MRYLGDKYAVSHAQSATSLSLLRSLKKARTPDETALVVADPVFSAKAAGGVAVALRRWRKMGVGGMRERGKPAAQAGADALFSRLEKTRELAGELQRLFGDGATVLVGEKASEAELSKLPLASYRCVAFATHGILDGTVPYVREPALVLAGAGKGNGAEGFLTMSEVTRLKLGAQAAALTACETGVGRGSTGEGVLGMGRAFQYAGAENVLMSLWPVAEDATVALGVEFFKGLKDGRTPREALKAARESVRRRGWEHPFFWSGFILMGR